MTSKQIVESKLFGLFYEHEGVGIDLANSLSKEVARLFDLAVKIASGATDHKDAVEGLSGEEKVAVESMVARIRIIMSFVEQ